MEIKNLIDTLCKKVNTEKAIEKLFNKDKKEIFTMSQLCNEFKNIVKCDTLSKICQKLIKCKKITFYKLPNHNKILYGNKEGINIFVRKIKRNGNTLLLESIDKTIHRIFNKYKKECFTQLQLNEKLEKAKTNLDRSVLFKHLRNYNCIILNNARTKIYGNIIALKKFAKELKKRNTKFMFTGGKN